MSTGKEYNKEVTYAASLLPKKLFARIALALFVLTTSAGLVYLAFIPTPEEKIRRTIEKEVPLTREQKALVVKRLNELSGDADGDGLKDWEEVLYKTDKNKADTDGDGTSDGDEIKLQRDPLKKGPDDSIAEETAARVAADAKGDTMTQRISEILAEDPAFAAALLNGPKTLSQEDINRLTDRIYQERPAHLRAIDESALYNPIKIIPDNSVPAIRNYFNALGAILNKYLTAAPKEDSLSVVEEATKTKDFGMLKKIEKEVGLFERSIAALQNIPTPSTLVDFQKRELLILAQSKDQVEGLMSAESDPITLLFLVPERLTLKKEASAFHQELREWLALRSIRFTETEGGVFFNKKNQ